MNTAQKMLEQMDYRDMTVLELVAESKVNRNTFYYHFKDMPMLITELARRSIDRCLAACKGDAGDKLACIVERMAFNKLSIMHVYSSAERAEFDAGLDQVCEYLCSRLCSVDAESDYRNALVKSCLYGLASHYLAKGMDDESRLMLAEACSELAKHIK